MTTAPSVLHAGVTQADFLRAASVYARHGLPVFPLYPPAARDRCSCGWSSCTTKAGQHPRIKWVHGEGRGNEPTTDIEVVRQWATENPVDGVAVPTDGLVVLDADEREGCSGAVTLAELERRLGELPDTVEVTTGSGTHYIFKAPTDVVIHCSVAELGPGLDVRATGGMVVGAGSLHRNGKLYAFAAGRSLDDISIASLPDEWVRELEKLESTRSPQHRFTMAEDVVLPVVLDPAKRPAGVIPKHYRNDTLFRYGCYIRREGGDGRLVREQLHMLNEQCSPRLSAAEVETIANSVLRYPQTDGRGTVMAVREWAWTCGLFTDKEMLTFLALLDKFMEVGTLEVRASCRNCVGLPAPPRPPSVATSGGSSNSASSASSRS